MPQNERSYKRLVIWKNAYESEFMIWKIKNLFLDETFLDSHEIVLLQIQGFVALQM